MKMNPVPTIINRNYSKNINYEAVKNMTSSNQKGHRTNGLFIHTFPVFKFMEDDRIIPYFVD